MKNVQLFEEFVNNLSSNGINEAEAAANVWPPVPPFQVDRKIIENPAYWADVDLDIPNANALGILEKDLPSEYTAYKDKTYNQYGLDSYKDAIVDYCDDKDDKDAEELTYRLLYGTDAWKKKYYPQGVKAGAKGLLKNEKPEEVDKHAMPALKNLVFLHKSQNGNKWIPLVDVFRAAYCKDESFEKFGNELKKVNPEFYKVIVDCYKYWMDNINKAKIQNVNPMAGKPKKDNPAAAPSF